MLRIFRRFLALALLLLWAGSIAIAIDGQFDNLHTADLAVVLGNKVRPDGQPSAMLKARLGHAVELYRQGYFKWILVSGGHGKEGYDEPVVMRHYLEANGVPHAAIFEDNQGYNTWQTARNTKAFLEQHDLKSVLIISQYFHMPRCRLAFAKFGIAPAYTSHAPFWSFRDFYSVPREVLGYGSYYFRRRSTTDSPTPRPLVFKPTGTGQPGKGLGFGLWFAR